MKAVKATSDSLRFMARSDILNNKRYQRHLLLVGQHALDNRRQNAPNIGVKAPNGLEGQSYQTDIHLKASNGYK
jgi:hypothetical protein